MAHAPKPVVQQALAAHEALDEWDADIVLAGSEILVANPPQTLKNGDAVKAKS